MNHVINLTVKAYLKALKISAVSPVDQVLTSRTQLDDGDAEVDKEVFEVSAINELHSVVVKIRTISKAVNFPPSRTLAFFSCCDAVGIKRLRPIKNHHIRWNATFSMLRRAIFLQKAIDLWTRSIPQYQNLVLSSREWEIAEFQLHFLAPFHHATMLLQSTSRPSLHKTFEMYENLFNSIENLQGAFLLMTVKPDWMSQIETAVDSMWTKLKDYYTTASDPFAYTESIILHPSLKLKWFKIHEWSEEDKGKYSTRFRERFEQIYSSQAVLALQLPPSKRQHEATLDSSDEEPEFGEVENYLGSKRVQYITDLLSWWANSRSIYPQLTQMARDIYVIPATGYSMEREFSIAGNIVTKRRNRLNADSISEYMQYKCWLANNNTLSSSVMGNEEENKEVIEKNDVSDLIDDEDEFNQDLIEWLNEWEANKKLSDRIVCLDLAMT